MKIIAQRLCKCVLLCRDILKFWLPVTAVLEEGGWAPSAENVWISCMKMVRFGAFYTLFGTKLNLRSMMLLFGWQEEHPSRKKTLLMRCWHGYLSRARCKWPADATATPSSLLQKTQSTESNSVTFVNLACTLTSVSIQTISFIHEIHNLQWMFHSQ